MLARARSAAPVYGAFDKEAVRLLKHQILGSGRCRFSADMWPPVAGCSARGCLVARGAARLAPALSSRGLPSAPMRSPCGLGSDSSASSGAPANRGWAGGARRGWAAAAAGGGEAAAAASGLGAPQIQGRPAWQIRMLYDGDCPLCMREVEMLQRRDAGRGAIDFVDIASPSYRAEDNSGITFEQAMERIHAVMADGTVVRDVEVFRRLYEAVGLGWVYAITKNPTVEALANKVYKVWADNRLPLTGRSDLGTILREKKSCAQGAAACEVEAPR